MNGYKEVPYTIEIDWVNSTVILNLPYSKEKIVVTEKVSKSIADGFRLIDAKKMKYFN
ncbi:hypothetical protein [Paenibacillus medicaginis]|uniref:Uncharacterized protein n=1 Tax=Paenibacillus medicaginis TaxID=1470560 RepID=A0ABV5BXK0_9BACL